VTPVLVCSVWLHGACRDACPVSDKPFYGKQKFVLWGACDIRIHCVCLQHGEAEQATLSATGESAYQCDSCAKSSGSSGIDMAPAKSPDSLRHHEGATSCASSNEEASSLNSVSTQLEAIRNNGKCTVDLVQSLVNMVTNLTKEFTDLKK
jgi:hypothetical protein